jgi:NO-binding membrane sensor protein with MHYT domain
MAANPGDLLVVRYDTTMVAASYVVSAMGSFFALECALRLRRKNGSLDWTMLAGAAIMLGGIGIWSMHFIGMQAYKLDVPISYDGLLTVVSLAAAIAIAGLALYLAGGSGKFNPRGWLVGSVIAALGVCLMHYLGMFAQILRATMTLDWVVVAISFVIALAAALAALWLAFNVRKRALRVCAALVMGLAVCAMHYTGMSAATLICTGPAPTLPAWTFHSYNLFEWTFCIAMLWISLMSIVLVMRIEVAPPVRTRR